MDLTIVCITAVLWRNPTPDGSGQIWLDNVQCGGTETFLGDCPANPFGEHNCGHHEDVGVECSPTGILCRKIIRGEKNINKNAHCRAPSHPPMQIKRGSWSYAPML